MRERALAMAVALAAAACGPSTFGSCTTSAGGITRCISYRGASFDSSRGIEVSCSAMGGTFSPQDCAPGAATCTFQAGTATEYVWTFPTLEGLPVESLCTTAGGTFTTR